MRNSARSWRRSARAFPNRLQFCLAVPIGRIPDRARGTDAREPKVIYQGQVFSSVYLRKQSLQLDFDLKLSLLVLFHFNCVHLRPTSLLLRFNGVPTEFGSCD